MRVYRRAIDDQDAELSSKLIEHFEMLHFLLHFLYLININQILYPATKHLRQFVRIGKRYVIDTDCSTFDPANIWLLLAKSIRKLQH